VKIQLIITWADDDYNDTMLSMPSMLSNEI
jgi:hypothetical protein